jgi:hypothetical protein
MANPDNVAKPAEIGPQMGLAPPGEYGNGVCCWLSDPLDPDDIALTAAQHQPPAVQKVQLR